MGELKSFFFSTCSRESLGKVHSAAPFDRFIHTGPNGGEVFAQGKSGLD